MKIKEWHRGWWLLVALVAAVSMWGYVQFVLRAHEIAYAAAHQQPRGNLSDLYPRWLGSRELLLRGRDPYSAEVVRDIQIGYYGRPLDPARPTDTKDQQAFAYPVYVAFELAPTVKLPFEVVQRGFFWFVIAITAISILLWTRALRWGVPASAKILWIVLTLGSFPAVQGFKLQQLTMPVAAMMAASFCALAGGWIGMAGVLLGLASIKPQLVGLPAAAMCVWCLGNWRERQRFVWGFGLTMVALIAGGEVLLPGWIGKFRLAAEGYWAYTHGMSVLDVELTPIFGRIVSVLLAGLLLCWAWRLRKAEVGSSDFAWLLALTMATTLCVIPMFAPYNQVLLLPALMVIVASVRELWRDLILRTIVVLMAISAVWPWMASLGLIAAAAFLPATTVQQGWPLPLYTNFIFPTLVLAVVLVGSNPLRGLRDAARAE